MESELGLCVSLKTVFGSKHAKKTGCRALEKHFNQVCILLSSGSLPFLYHAPFKKLSFVSSSIDNKQAEKQMY